MATEKYERLKVVRRGHRGVVTKLTREVDTLLAGESPTSEQLARLNIIFEQLENKMQLLQTMDSEIVTLCNLDDVEGEIDESESILAKILEYKGRVSMAIRPKVPTSRDTISADPSRGSVPTVPAGVDPVLPNGNTRLPKLILPKFRGNVTAWTPFWDAFKAAVHENPNISKVDKFNYLNSLVEGAAAMTIQGLSLTEGNYDSAVEMLQTRFGNPQQIITSHMEELLKLHDCVGDKASPLRSMYDKVNVHIRGLQSLGIDLKQYGSLLIPVVMSKLPGDIRLRIARENRGEVWEMDKLMETIQLEVEAREASEATKVSMGRVSSSRAVERSANATASALVVGNHNIQCVYCKGNHFSASCNSVKSVMERRSVLLKEGRCFVCLKSNHRAQNCDSDKKCRRCGRRHHQSLCEGNYGSTGSGPGNDSKNETSTNTANNMKDKKTILLQTARAVASNEDGSKKISVRLLLDSGSQRSYLTESLKYKLSLPTAKKEKLYLNTFGSEHFKTQQCEIVRVWLTKPGKEGAIIIDALSFPTICTPLPTIVEVNKYPCLADLELADDFSDDSGDIDLLIGSDFYWSIITGEVLRTNGGPTAMNSKLGWLLSGPTDGTYSLITLTNLSISEQLHLPIATSEEDELTKTLKNFWQLESLGIQPESLPEPHEMMFLKNLQFNGTHYEVGLPWTRDAHDLPSHLNMCLNRTKALQNRLLKDIGVLREYDLIIKEQLKKGIVERILDAEIHNNRTHYMPHLPVVRADRSTTKVRVVYDGSARSKESKLTLNDHLQKGPNLIPKLFDVLIRFRNHPVAVTADIEKAFLMIGIEKSDRDMLRFLWFLDPFNIHSEMIHLRFTRLVFGLRPSPAILGEVIRQHCHQFEKEHPKVVQLMNHSLYVDDLISGEETVESAYKLYQVAKRIMAKGDSTLENGNPTLRNYES